MRAASQVARASSLAIGPLGMARRLVVVGLGNHGMPGTRHSVGHTIVELMAAAASIVPDAFAGCMRTPRTHDVPPLSDDAAVQAAARAMLQRDRKAKCAMAEVPGVPLVLANNLSFMNVCGPNVRRAVSKYGWPDAAALCVIVDDLDLPLGEVKLKRGGSARGHNGVKSAISSLQSMEFLRVRVGIGRPAAREDVVEHVLGHFTDAENEVVRDRSLPKVLDIVAAALAECCEPEDAVGGGDAEPAART